MRETSRARRRAIRMCVACRRHRPKAELLRIVRTPDGARFDRRQRLPGRGAYLCAGPECVEVTARRNGHPLQRALRGVRHDQVSRALDEVRNHLARTTGQNPRGGRPGRRPGAGRGASAEVAGVTEHHEEQNA